MNEEFLIDLAEAMLNEGIDEDSIISILSSLVEEQEEVLPISESCFDSIVSLTEVIIKNINEGIMDDIKGGMDPQKAKAKWVKQKNKEYIEGSKKEDEANRLLRKAVNQDPQVYIKAFHNLKKIRKIQDSKFNTQNVLGHKQDNSATYNKMVMPAFKEINGSIKKVGFEKGGKTYKPKKD